MGIAWFVAAASSGVATGAAASVAAASAAGRPFELAASFVGEMACEVVAQIVVGVCHELT